MRAIRLLAVAAATALSVSYAVAGPQLEPPTADYIPSPFPGPDVAAALSTGFEAPFVPGNLNGQQGWTVSTIGGVPITTNTIETNMPASGVQHLQQIDRTASTNGTVLGAFSPNLPQVAPDSSVISVDLKVTNTGGANYSFRGQSPAQAFTTFRMEADFGGNIIILVNNAGVLSFLNTGVPWPVNQYFNMKVVFDPAPGALPGSNPPPMGTVSYFLNNTLLTTQNNLVAGTVVDQVLFLNDQFQLANEIGRWDNLSVTAVPEPTSLALLGLGSLALVRRRRA